MAATEKLNLTGHTARVGDGTSAGIVSSLVVVGRGIEGEEIRVEVISRDRSGASNPNTMVRTCQVSVIRIVSDGKIAIEAQVEVVPYL